MNSGVQLKLPEPLPLSVNAAPPGRADVVRAGTDSASEAETDNTKTVPSVIEVSEIGLSAGNWLPASLTVIITVSVSHKMPSLVKNVTT